MSDVQFRHMCTYRLKGGGLEAVRNCQGRLCAWLEDDTLCDLRGRIVAFIFGREIVRTDGRHLGRIEDGNIRDHCGAVVAWTENAQGGPIKPAASVAPIPPIRALAPSPPTPPVPPIPAISLLSWSTMTWKQFVQQ
jgi:hypothetical protein